MPMLQHPPPCPRTATPALPLSPPRPAHLLLRAVGCRVQRLHAPGVVVGQARVHRQGGTQAAAHPHAACVGGRQVPPAGVFWQPNGDQGSARHACGNACPDERGD
eukprot:159597-Chlamydomonas_euryale.AAC.1